jgi:hypothetical protein
MSRTVCLTILLGSLVAAPGCSSCFGGFSSCRRPSFMEFRSPCRGQAEPCHAAPVCEPACGPACGPAAGGGCCEEGGAVMSAPVSAPIVGEPGTFS